MECVLFLEQLKSKTVSGTLVDGKLKFTIHILVVIKTETESKNLVNFV